MLYIIYYKMIPLRARSAARAPYKLEGAACGADDVAILFTILLQ